MMRIILIPSLLLLLTSMSCKDTQKTETDALFDQVMTEHDEAMALMVDLFNQTKRIKSMRKSGETQKRLDRLEVKERQLNEAEEAMMDWMANFKKPDEQTDPKEAKKYLDEQYQRIKTVHQKMKKAISDAKAFEDN